MAITLRESLSASRNGWSALLWDARHGTLHESQHYDVTLVDRIGGGDSFRGADLRIAQPWAPERALRFAVAASALKQTIPGDFNRVSVAEVERLAARRRQRAGAAMTRRFGQGRHADPGPP